MQENPWDIPKSFKSSLQDNYRNPRLFWVTWFYDTSLSNYAYLNIQ